MPDVMVLWKHPVFWGYLLLINLAAVVIYGVDKHRARRQGQRVPEATLHLLAALGASPGALLAQQMFRHKTRKKSFQVTFGLIVLLQALLVCWLVGVI